MLVLTAKRDDRIRIGDNIEILIIYTADSRVRIGIEAPRDLRIERKPRQATPANLSNPTDPATTAARREAASGESPAGESAPDEAAPNAVEPTDKLILRLALPESEATSEVAALPPARLDGTIGTLIAVEPGSCGPVAAHAEPNGSGSATSEDSNSAKSDNPDSSRIAAPLRLVGAPPPATINGRNRPLAGPANSDGTATQPHQGDALKPSLPLRPKGKSLDKSLDK